ncbi:hypothetical protein L1987_05117 [Smallanthus sonchifolius]|uniref:Uncharacterized protein n=1 Tax=Smallanthus sonchifolius TaxID=185202 RepID=A0ACB9JUF7_9ASTR|nr:hypothetical protein L1987_05117 [Smallanthus sonchifolius]
MSRLAGDKLVDSENSVAIRSNWVSSMVEFVWKRRNALVARSLILPVESFRASVYPLVYAVKSVASGSIEAFKKLSRSSKKTSTSTLDSSMAERFVGVSDVVTHLAPFLASSLDPALIFEVECLSVARFIHIRGPDHVARHFRPQSCKTKSQQEKNDDQNHPRSTNQNSNLC